MILEQLLCPVRSMNMFQSQSRTMTNNTGSVNIIKTDKSAEDKKKILLSLRQDFALTTASALQVVRHAATAVDTINLLHFPGKARN